MRKSTKTERRKSPARSGSAKVRSSRQRAGDDAETAVAQYLTRLGWEICGRNVRVGRYELDLIAIDGKTAVIVEVRTRGLTAWTTAIGSIDAGKRERMRSAASRIWRDWFRRRADIDHLRFDVAAVRYNVTGEPTIEHIRAAFA